MPCVYCLCQHRPTLPISTTDDDVHARAVGEIRAKYPDAHRAGDVAAEWAGAFLRMDRGAV